MALLSLILPYRDAASTINEAIQSILDQTFRDFEVIAVNDHSRDESTDILSSMQDDRFRLYDNPGEGLVDALNFALSIASAPWIARMDADDIMHPDKLEIQWRYLAAHPEVDVLSCQAQLFPEEIITDGFL
jgi:glycosyltransferase involved in cell wall biosynthesis